MPNPVDAAGRQITLGLLRYPQSLFARMKGLGPRGLFGQSALLLAAPIIISQVVGTWVFYDRLWSTVMRRLSDAAANDIALVVEGRRAFHGSGDEKSFLELVDRNSGIRATFLPRTALKSSPDAAKGTIEQYLAAALRERNIGAFEIDASELPRQLLVRVQDSDGLEQISVPRDRLYTSMIYVFLMWMVGTALVTLAIAMLFLRAQAAALQRLAIAADAFGRGLDVPHFEPQGTTEMRQAAAAFQTMRQRIQRQVKQRTEMLAGISHDLRTPLTRMRLELEILRDGKDVRALESDIIEMQKMIDAYLSFARGEGDETAQVTDLMTLLRDVVAEARREGARIALTGPDELELPVRRDALKRCVTNLITNAARYGSHMWVTILPGHASIDIIIDDDGPGIPEPMREAVFQPFFRLDNSRNPSTGGIGLGLTIARDVMLGHGGNLLLEVSPRGGLRARASLPALDARLLFRDDGRGEERLWKSPTR
jgi:two-component system, OmpR family, osmolarity sensor histidine kinase EnvZ